MFATSGPRCPVQLFKQYLRLGPNAAPFMCRTKLNKLQLRSDSRYIFYTYVLHLLNFLNLLEVLVLLNVLNTL